MIHAAAPKDRKGRRAIVVEEDVLLSLLERIERVEARLSSLSEGETEQPP